MKMKKKSELQATPFIWLLYLSIEITTCCEDLRCYVDYIDTLTCEYDTVKEAKHGISYHLTTTWTVEDPEADTPCPLIQSANTHKYTCWADMSFFSSEDTFNISIQRTVYGQRDSAQDCGPFLLSENFVPATPYNLSVSFSDNYNISWKTMYEGPLHFLRDGEVAYELSYRKEEDSWENQKCIHILEDEKNVILLKSSFQEDAEYVARVRAKPGNTSMYHGAWSEWSAPTTWTTQMDVNGNGNTWPFKNWIALLCGGIIIAIMVMFKPLKLPQRLWKNVWVFVPSPAFFFKPLYMGHNGDFKSWLGSSYNMATLQFEGGVVLPEALEIYSRNRLQLASKAGFDDMEKHETLATSKTSSGNHSQDCRIWKGPGMLTDRSFEHISIDTVIVSDESTPCCSQCITSNGLNINNHDDDDDDEDNNGDDGYPSVNLDSSNSHLLKHLLPNKLNSEASITFTSERSLDLQENLARCSMNIFDFISRSPEEWELQVSPSQEDESVFYSDAHYESLSPSSGNSEDFGYPRLCLDLDTIDSGFVDSDCGSPVECEFENKDISQKIPSLEPFQGQEGESFQRNYVQQFVPFKSTNANGFSKK